MRLPSLEGRQKMLPTSDNTVPGEIYRPSSRLRPARLPEARIEGECRKVDASGKFWYKSRRYRAGKGLIDDWIDIRDEAIFYAGSQDRFSFRAESVKDVLSETGQNVLSSYKVRRRHETNQREQ